MLNRTYFAFPLAALALCITSQAVADVAPPTTYVEECTVEKQATETSECVACKAIRYGEGLDRCEQLLSPYCYTNACGSWGGTVYTEVWCRTKSDNPVIVPQSIAAQLNVYDAPKLDTDAGAGGAANCTPSVSTAAGGTPAVSTPSSATPSPDPVTTTELVEEAGCSVSRATNASGKASLGFLGLLGLMLVMNRKNTRKNA